MVEVTTADGVVRGHRGRRTLRWRSIPYAAPPVGPLRFRAPQPVEPWSGVRDATQFGFAAMQHRTGARIGPRRLQPTGEDCLTLNVTAPATPSATPRPVLVFIHGGGYVLGTSALSLYSGSRLAMLGDVIVVSMNYRLGAFGYVDFSELSTPERPFDSNLGLRDQVAALQWVRRNIAAFGGDPDNVTIFGESAGGHAVVSLLATPAAAGLFHRGIAQSAPADWAVGADDARVFARRCLENLGATPHDAAAALTTSPANDIRKAVDRALDASLWNQPGSFPAAPVVDGDYLPRAPIDAIAGGSAHAVPLIIGTNRDEGTLFSRFDRTLPTTPQQLHKALARCGEDVESRIVAAYPGYPAAKVAIRMGGDFVFWRPTIALADGHSRYAPTYVYRFDYAPRAIRLAGFGATHALDLIPVFGGVDTPIGRALTVTGGYRGFLAVQREFQSHWLSFARTGKPRDSWPEYTEQRRSTRIIDHPSRVEVDPERAKRLAWAGVRVPALG
ncbi:carboxylesterase/lipase family protein [Nocardia sp. CDC159]|uniref:Carboxylic ester hydrolase n=1 Tax=Nocardia pulmonis TaxID=2951408 RepID=A0A9X2E7E5_9NOCA|nr:MULTISPECIES: carboxylesterase/lipase family protein [Nocardia]MCM6775129.1 carboxylesterase/lipase family protein [Nocardia pulmonis]MCM6789599.1 carboxylesterase/lipase family protein [Nocardia sp. CDC159]